MSWPEDPIRASVSAHDGDAAAVDAAWITADGSLHTRGPQTPWPWWSVTKTVLAAAALRLVEAGRLELDAPSAEGGYTLRQLLQHRAGVPNYGGLAAYHEAVAHGETPWSRAELLARVGVERSDFLPGTGWAYSNVGYLLVREQIEAVTGDDLDAALRALVLAPSGLDDVRLATAPGDLPAAPLGYDPAWVFHGCLRGTPGDAARFIHAVLAGNLLGAPSRRALTTAHRLGAAVPGRPWTEHGYGLGLMVGEMAAVGPALGHSGGGPGSVAAVYHFRDRAVTVATFALGADEGVAERAAAAVAREVGRAGPRG